jgi:hypothetical protein
MLNLDTIGSPLGGNGVYEPRTISVYSERIPTDVTANDIALGVASNLLLG